MFDIYSITAFILFYFSFVFWNSNLKVNKNALHVFLLCLLFLIIHDGFRWEIGTDWDNYRALFEYEEDAYHMGLAYVLFNQLIHKLSNDYTAVTVSIAVIMYGIIGVKFIEKYSPQPFMSLCLMYTGLMGLMGCNRQLLALTFCLLSIKFIFDRNFFYFLSLVILGMAFHITAILFIPSYFLLNYKYSSKILMRLVLLSFIIGLFKIVNYLPFAENLAMIDAVTNSTNLSSYLTNEETFGVSIVGSFKRIAFVGLALWSRPFINKSIYDFAVIMYAVGAIIYLMFNGTMLQMLAGRGCLYFNIFDLIWIPYMISYIPVRNTTTRYLMWIIFFIFYLYIMNRDMNSYYLQDGIDIFRPYKSVFFK